MGWEESRRLTTYTFEASTKAVMPFICSLTVDNSSQKAVDLGRTVVVVKTFVVETVVGKTVQRISLREVFRKIRREKLRPKNTIYRPF